MTSSFHIPIASPDSELNIHKKGLGKIQYRHRGQPGLWCVQVVLPPLGMQQGWVTVIAGLCFPTALVAIVLDLTAATSAAATAEPSPTAHLPCNHHWGHQTEQVGWWGLHGDSVGRVHLAGWMGWYHMGQGVASGRRLWLYPRPEPCAVTTLLSLPWPPILLPDADPCPPMAPIPLYLLSWACPVCQGPGLVSIETQTTCLPTCLPVHSV